MRLAVAAAAAFALSVSPALAVDPRGFEPPTSAGAILGLDTTRISPALVPFATLVASVADDEIDDVTTRLATSLVAGVTLVDWLELGVGGTLYMIGGDDGDFGPGDVRVGVKARLTGRARELGVAVAIGASLPTGSVRYGSEDGLALDPRVVLDWRGDDVLVALSLGYRLRPGGMVGAVAVDDELRFGLGVEARLAPAVTMLGELDGAYGLDATPAARATPLELRVGARIRLGDWAVTAGAGTRLTDGYGVPDIRVVVALGWAPPPFPPYARMTTPPDAPPFAAPPPMDLAIVLAADPDADGDGVPTPRDRCPDVPEDVDRHADDDGCPDPDNDGDGVLDTYDRCPVDREIVNGLVDDDGCPDGQPGTAGAAGVVARAEGPRVTDDGRIALPGVIEFHSGSDVLLPDAVELLAQVARFMQAEPSIARVRIEGHTDDRGDEEEQVDLSERRAASVRKALIARGVAPDRLLPKGFGKTQPLTDNRDGTARRTNRRVELRVIAAPDPGAAP